MLTTLLPGLLPLAQRRLLSGALFLFTGLWLRLMLAAQATPGQRLGAFFAGPFGMEGDGLRPLVVFITGLVVLVHVLARFDARRRASPPG